MRISNFFESHINSLCGSFRIMSNRNQRLERIRYLMRLVANSQRPESSNDSDYEDIIENLVFSEEREKSLKKMLRDDSVAKTSYESPSIEAQSETEQTIKEMYKDVICGQGVLNSLNMDKHLNYIKASLKNPLSYHYQVLDANHGWLLYWLLNSQAILSSEEEADNLKNLVSEKVTACVVDGGKGGIAGGKNQYGHIAPTYASVLALACVGEYEVLNEIRSNLYQWMMSLKKKNGSFMMHRNGESDTRSTYCILVVASLLNMITDELIDGTAKWISSCQTYEGGFAGQPGDEAHGGYTFCATASFFLLLGREKDFHQALGNYIDVENLIRWSVNRQLALEGGFNGRSNKLVDSCYSFWIGSTLSMLEVCTGSSGLFDRDALANYVLICSQNPKGGFRDKPGKSVDFHHTNYALCGLSICQHRLSFTKPSIDRSTNDIEVDVKHLQDKYAYSFKVESELYKDINIHPISPVFSIPLSSVKGCEIHFRGFDSPKPLH